MKRVIVLTFAVALSLAQAASADPIQTVDLKPYVGPSPVDSMGTDWQVPHGRQVMDGIAFQIDGVVSFRATNSVQRKKPGRTDLTGIVINAHFECLHLLCAADADANATNGTPVATLHIHYADGSESAADLRIGENIRYWAEFRHKAAAPIQDTNVHEVWRAQNSTAAASDKYLRLFHVPLPNPSSEKEVASLSIESARTQCGLMLLGLSFGSAAAEALPDTVTMPKSPLPDLAPRTGELVHTEGYVKTTNGLPIAGAHVRVGTVQEIGQDYSSGVDSDVGFMADTDANGHFVLPPLSDQRCYGLQILADGYQPGSFRGADPKSDPVEIRLKSRPADWDTGKFAVNGKVLGTNGLPIPFVVVEPIGVGNPDGSTWGVNQGFPDQVMTDTNGQFHLARQQEFERVQVRVQLPGLSPATVWLPITNGLQTIQLGVGGKLTGRVVKDGKPRVGVRVGVAGKERGMEVFAGHFETRTDTNGIFSFDHLPENTSWDLYGLMASLKSYGAVAPRLAQTGASGTTTDVGDLIVKPGLHLVGEIKTKSGEPLPQGLQLYMGYEDGWDSQNMKLDATGHFRFDGLAPVVITLSVQGNNNWSSLAADNRSIDNLNPWRLMGKLEDNKDDLLVLIENRERRYGSSGSGNGQLPAQDQPQGRPIFGAEPSGPAPIILAGTVVDDSTGKPVPEFNIVPGYKPPVTAPAFSPPKTMLQQVVEPFSHNKVVPWNERIYWEYAQQETISNGMFALNFMRLSSSPVLQIEAKGYEPLETDPTNMSATNLVLRLKRGAGPNGIVLLPDGNPAEGATITYGAKQEQFSMEGTKLNSYGDNDSLQTTGKDGKFSFLKKNEGVELFVSHPQGWVQLSVENGGGDGVKLRLKPWATLTGILVDTSNAPLARTPLAMTMFHDWQKGGALVNLQGRCTTDAAGRFMFTNVPPSRVEINRLININAGSYSYQVQTWLVPTPGITNDLGRVIVDHPPPEAVLDQIKQRLGL